VGSAGRRLFDGEQAAVLPEMRPLGRLVLFVLVWLVLIAMLVGLLLLVPYYFFVLGGQEARAKKANEKLLAAIMDGESIVHVALQRRIVALWSRRHSIAITNSRVITVERPLFGGFAMKDYQWKDLRDVQLSENVLPQWFGSRLHFTIGEGSFEVDGISSDDAAKMYRHAQHQEQAWEEKRRVRQLEEMRAAAGGVVMNGAGGAANDASIGASLDELERTKRLLDTGVISDAEYHEIKAKILSRAAS
jgi:preprotein translocase subunit YajC